MRSRLTPLRMTSPQNSASVYLGIMSGTSLDAIDIAACTFADKKIELLGFHSTGWPNKLRATLLELATARSVELDTLVQTHFDLATEYAGAVKEALHVWKINSENI